MAFRTLSTQARPGVAVVVPLEPGGTAEACLKALRALPKAERGLIRELFVVRGLQPSRQRNAAWKASRAPWILLDSDAQALPGTLRALLGAAQGPASAGAGGPNLAPVDETPFGLAVDRVLGSWVGSQASRARYRAVGERRLAGEKELILCNLLLRREALAACGGFREDLYPNEENELIHRLQEQGWTLTYQPAAAVRRPRRQSLAAFVGQAFAYGRGRARQMRAAFYLGDLWNLQALLLPLAWAFSLWAGWALPAAYACFCLWGLGLRLGPALLAMLRHHAYAAGLIAGAVLPAPTPPALPPALERLTWRP